MRCQFCHNPDTWDVKAPVQYDWTPEELLVETLRYRNFIRSGGVTATGGEPLMQPEFLRDYFRLCKQEGLHTCLDTSGAVWSEEALSVLDYTDLVMLDIKTLDDGLHKTYTGLSRRNNERWLEHLERIGKSTWIRHVVVPGVTDNDDMLQRLAEHIAGYSCVECVELLPYHSMGKEKYERLGIPYPLKDVPDMTRERMESVRSSFRDILERLCVDSRTVRVQ